MDQRIYFRVRQEKGEGEEGAGPKINPPQHTHTVGMRSFAPTQPGGKGARQVLVQTKRATLFGPSPASLPPPYFRLSEAFFSYIQRPRP